MMTPAVEQADPWQVKILYLIRSFQGHDGSLVLYVKNGEIYDLRYEHNYFPMHSFQPYGTTLSAEQQNLLRYILDCQASWRAGHKSGTLKIEIANGHKGSDRWQSK